MPARIYLCGPMTGLSLSRAGSWRLTARELLPPPNFECVSPMRGKEVMQYGVGGIPCEESVLDQFPAISSPSGIVGRDRWDVMRADALLANFLGADRVSIGSCFELAWANLLHKPVAVVMEDRANPHDHTFVTRTATYRCSTLEEAAQCLKTMFN